MTTDTFTLPRHARTDADSATTRPRSESPAESGGSAVDWPRPTKRGAGQLLRSLLSDASGQPASDPLMLLGPNGGPLWATRIR